MRENDELILELKELMQDLHMRPRELCQQIGVSEQVVYRWLKGSSGTAAKSRKKIMQVIALFRTGAFAEELGGIELEDLSLNKIIYDKLGPLLSATEKAWLLEDGNYLVYHKRLRELNAQNRARKAGHES